jgi:phosphoketolase
MSEPKELESISPYGLARSTVKGSPLSKEEIEKYNDFFKASTYLSLGMIYLRSNPLLQEPLTTENLKARLLGHFGSARKHAPLNYEHGRKEARANYHILQPVKASPTCTLTA